MSDPILWSDIEGSDEFKSLTPSDQITVLEHWGKSLGDLSDDKLVKGFVNLRKRALDTEVEIAKQISEFVGSERDVLVKLATQDLTEGLSAIKRGKFDDKGQKGDTDDIPVFSELARGLAQLDDGDEVFGVVEDENATEESLKPYVTRFFTEAKSLQDKFHKLTAQNAQVQQVDYEDVNLNLSGEEISFQIRPKASVDQQGIWQIKKGDTVLDVELGENPDMEKVLEKFGESQETADLFNTDISAFKDFRNRAIQGAGGVVARLVGGSFEGVQEGLSSLTTSESEDPNVVAERRNRNAELGVDINNFLTTKVASVFKGNPAIDVRAAADFKTRVVRQGLPQVAGELPAQIGAFAAGGVGGAVAFGAVDRGLAGSIEAREFLRDSDLTPEEIKDAVDKTFRASAAVGAAEGVTDAVVFGGLKVLRKALPAAAVTKLSAATAKLQANAFTRITSDITSRALVGSAAEGAAERINNEIAQAYYDENREDFENVPEALAIGIIAEGLTATGSVAVKEASDAFNAKREIDPKALDRAKQNATPDPDPSPDPNPNDPSDPRTTPPDSPTSDQTKEELDQRANENAINAQRQARQSLDTTLRSNNTTPLVTEIESDDADTIPNDETEDNVESTEPGSIDGVDTPDPVNTDPEETSDTEADASGDVEAPREGDVQPSSDADTEATSEDDEADSELDLEDQGTGGEIGQTQRIADPPSSGSSPDQSSSSDAKDAEVRRNIKDVEDIIASGDSRLNDAQSRLDALQVKIDEAKAAKVEAESSSNPEPSNVEAQVESIDEAIDQAVDDGEISQDQAASITDGDLPSTQAEVDALQSRFDNAKVEFKKELERGVADLKTELENDPDTQTEVTEDADAPPQADVDKLAERVRVVGAKNGKLQGKPFKVTPTRDAAVEQVAQEVFGDDLPDVRNKLKEAEQEALDAQLNNKNKQRDVDPAKVVDEAGRRALAAVVARKLHNDRLVSEGEAEPLSNDDIIKRVTRTIEGDNPDPSRVKTVADKLRKQDQGKQNIQDRQIADESADVVDQVIDNEENASIDEFLDAEEGDASLSNLDEDNLSRDEQGIGQETVFDDRDYFESKAQGNSDNTVNGQFLSDVTDGVEVPITKPKSRRVAKFVKKISEIFGAKIEFFDGSVSSNLSDGYYMPATQTVLINSNLSPGRILSQVIGHEIGHHIETQNPELWNDLVKGLIDSGIDAARFQKYKNDFLQDYDRDQYISEVLAEMMGEVIDNPNSLRNIRDVFKNDTLFSKFLTHIEPLIDALVTAMRSLARTALKAQDRRALDMLENRATGLHILNETLKAHVLHGTESNPVYNTPIELIEENRRMRVIHATKEPNYPATSVFESKKTLNETIADNPIVKPEDVFVVSRKSAREAAMKGLRSVPELKDVVREQPSVEQAEKLRKFVARSDGGNKALDAIEQALQDELTLRDIDGSRDLALTVLARLVEQQISDAKTSRRSENEELFARFQDSGIGGESTITINNRDRISHLARALGALSGWRAEFGVLRQEMTEATRQTSAKGVGGRKKLEITDKVSSTVESQKESINEEVADTLRSDDDPKLAERKTETRSLLQNQRNFFERLLKSLFPKSNRKESRKPKETITGMDQLEQFLKSNIERIDTALADGSLESMETTLAESNQAMVDTDFDIKDTKAKRAVTKGKKEAKKTQKKIEKTEVRKFFERRQRARKAPQAQDPAAVDESGRRIKRKRMLDAFNKAVKDLGENPTAEDVNTKAQELSGTELFKAETPNVIAVELQTDIDRNNKRREARRVAKDAKATKERDVEEESARIVGTYFTPQPSDPARQKGDKSPTHRNIAKRILDNETAVGLEQDFVDALTDAGVLPEYADVALQVVKNRRDAKIKKKSDEKAKKREEALKKDLAAERKARQAKLVKLPEKVEGRLPFGDRLVNSLREAGIDPDKWNRTLGLDAKKKAVKDFLRSRPAYRNLAKNDLAVDNLVSALDDGYNDESVGLDRDPLFEALDDARRESVGSRKSLFTFFADMLEGSRVFVEGKEIKLRGPDGAEFKTALPSEKIKIVKDWLKDNVGDKNFENALRAQLDGPDRPLIEADFNKLASQVVKKYDGVVDKVVKRRAEELTDRLNAGPGMGRLTLGDIKQIFKLSVLDQTLSPVAAIGLAKGSKFTLSLSTQEKLIKLFDEHDNALALLPEWGGDTNQLTNDIERRISTVLQTEIPGFRLPTMAAIRGGMIASLFSAAHTKIVVPIASGVTSAVGDYGAQSIKMIHDRMRGGNLGAAESAELMIRTVLTSLGVRLKSFDDLDKIDFRRSHVFTDMFDGLRGIGGVNVIGNEAAMKDANDALNKNGDPMFEQIAVTVELIKKLGRTEADGRKPSVADKARLAKEVVKVFFTARGYVFRLMGGMDGAVNRVMKNSMDLFQAFDWMSDGRISRDQFEESMTYAAEAAQRKYEEYERTMLLFDADRPVEGGGIKRVASQAAAKKAASRRRAVILATVNAEMSRDFLYGIASNPDNDVTVKEAEDAHFHSDLSARTATGTSREVIGLPSLLLKKMVAPIERLRAERRKSDRGVLSEAGFVLLDLAGGIMPVLMSATIAFDRHAPSIPLYGMLHTRWARQGRELRKTPNDKPKLFDGLKLAASKRALSDHNMARMNIQMVTGQTLSLLGLMMVGDDEDDLIQVFAEYPGINDQKERNRWKDDKKIKPYMIRINFGDSETDIHAGRGVGTQLLMPFLFAKRMNNLFNGDLIPDDANPDKPVGNSLSAATKTTANMVMDMVELGMPFLNEVSETQTGLRNDFSVKRRLNQAVTAVVDPVSSFSRNIENVVHGYSTATSEEFGLSAAPTWRAMFGRAENSRGAQLDDYGRQIKADTVWEKLTATALPFSWGRKEKSELTGNQDKLWHLHKESGYISSTNNSPNSFLKKVRSIEPEDQRKIAKNLGLKEESSWMDIREEYMKQRAVAIADYVQSKRRVISKTKKVSLDQAMAILRKSFDRETMLAGETDIRRQRKNVADILASLQGSGSAIFSKKIGITKKAREQEAQDELDFMFGLDPNDEVFRNKPKS